MATWIKYECGAGSRWTAVHNSPIEIDKEGDACQFSGCGCGTQIRIVGYTESREEACGWFRRANNLFRLGREKHGTTEVKMGTFGKIGVIHKVENGYTYKRDTNHRVKKHELPIYPTFPTVLEVLGFLENRNKQICMEAQADGR